LTARNNHAPEQRAVVDGVILLLTKRVQVIVISFVKLLVTLDVNSNNLKDLVSDIHQLRTLEVLDVSSNQFESLARNLDYLYTLRRLNVANNLCVLYIGCCLKVTSRVLPYSLPSAGPGADPSAQAVRLQVTI